ncbi:hypothetical protein BC828DRAFT_402149 [Blastocladiella britannica]|nr:hypothetical protein BC828DRAFT_402149 [Blastocladiella britannica]
MIIDHVAHIILAYAAGAIGTPEEAISVLNVLPRHDTVLSAVLSRGFLDYDPELAVKHGHGLALIPHYPSYILMNDLGAKVMAAFKLGQLSTLELLWKRAGPHTCGHLYWAESRFYPIYLALETGSIEIVEWYDRVAINANLKIDWTETLWSLPARQGHFHLIWWGLEHGHLRALTPSIALESAKSGDLSLIRGWLADQPDLADAITQLKRELKYPYWFEDVSISTLEWWWTYIAGGMELPAPHLFAQIINACFSKQDTAFLEWWWALFLQQRTPEYTFGTRDLVSAYHSWRIPITNADWLWRHSHSSGAHWDSSVKAFAFAPDWHDVKLPDLLWLNDSDSIDLVRWWIEKSVIIGQKLVVSPHFVECCGERGLVDRLECVLQFYGQLDVKLSRAEISLELKEAQYDLARPKDIERFEEYDTEEESWPNFDDHELEFLKAHYAGTLPAHRRQWRQQVYSGRMREIKDRSREYVRIKDVLDRGIPIWMESEDDEDVHVPLTLSMFPE